MSKPECGDLYTLIHGTECFCNVGGRYKWTHTWLRLMRCSWRAGRRKGRWYGTSHKKSLNGAGRRQGRDCQALSALIRSERQDAPYRLLFCCLKSRIHIITSRGCPSHDHRAHTFNLVADLHKIQVAIYHSPSTRLLLLSL
jgi:hypothetical protein